MQNVNNQLIWLHFIPLEMQTKTNKKGLVFRKPDFMTELI